MDEMEKRCRLVFLLFLSLGFLSSTAAGDLPAKAAAAIRAEEIRAQLDFLAADALLGRNTPGPGLDTAAAFIARSFQASGLAPVNGSYFQEFGLHRIFLGDTNTCRITGIDGQEREYRIKKEFMPYEMTANKSCSGEIVFAGYGITDPESGYDDYAGIEVKDKIVLVLKRGPRQNDPASPFFMHKDVRPSRIDEKIKNAIAHGAAGILLVTDPLHNRILTPRGFPWPSLYKGFPPEAVPVTLGGMEDEKIPAIQVGEEAMVQLFGSVAALRGEQAAIDSAMAPRSRVLAGCRTEIRTSTHHTVQQTRNVAGLLEGRDPRLKQEVVIIGAHYDHLGCTEKSAAGQDSIYNGADDNASGTVGVLAAARAFASAGKRPRRSVLFIAFAGEEKGLFGSTHYVKEPLIPLDVTAAMLNMDMIGRNHPDSLTITGHGSSRELEKALHRANGKCRFMLEMGKEGAMRGSSDHAPFARKQIPVLFFHSGMHADYHKVSDEADKCDAGKMARVTELCSRVAWLIADQKEKPLFIPPVKPAKQ